MPNFQIISSLRDHLGQPSQWTVAALVFIITISVLALKSWWDDRASRSITDEFTVGEITPDELQRYSGQVPFLPLLLAVRGVIYDVTKGKEFYGPGKSASDCFVTRKTMSSGFHTPSRPLCSILSCM